MIGRLVHAIMRHPNKDALVADLRSKHPYTPFSEKSKTNDSHYGKRGMLRIVWSVSQNSMYLLIASNIGWTELFIVLAVTVKFPQMQHETETKRIAWRRRTRKDSNRSFIVFRRVESIDACRRTSDGLKSFADAQTNSQKKTTRTLPLGKNVNDMQRCGRHVETAEDLQHQCDHEPTFLQHCESFVKWDRKQPRLDTDSTP